MTNKVKAQVLSEASDLTGIVEFEENGWFPTVRSLTDAEFHRAQSRMFSGQKMVAHTGSEAPESLALDLGSLIEGEFEARVLICSFGLSVDEKWSPAEVKKIPYTNAIQKISDKVLELGGHDLYGGLKRGVRQNVETFRNQSGGSGDDGASVDGGPSGEGPALHDDGSEDIPLGSFEGDVPKASGE